MIQIQVFLQTKTILLEVWYNRISLAKISSPISWVLPYKSSTLPSLQYFKNYFHYLQSCLWIAFPSVLMDMYLYNINHQSQAIIDTNTMKLFLKQ